ncbi:MAG: LPS export ABC transporter periplasmic protein LptC [Bacteroidia bacterium]|nr:LPS export ABC transporter periplasmic protein LptC [Bacteroidia bacterium]
MLLLFFSCENDISTVKLIRPDSLPAETALGVELIYSDSANVKVRVTAPRMERYEQPSHRIILPEGVFVEFFDDSGKVKSWLKADYAINYEGEEKMEVRRNVVVLNERGERLETEQLIWSRKEAKVFTNEPVRIRRKDEIMEGKGLVASQDFSDYDILEPTGTKYIEDEQDE